MKQFNASHLEDIKSRIDLIDLVTAYLPLKKAGANYKGCCPFHSEKTASFIVSPAKQIFHCFGCHEGGDAFGFLMKMDHLSFPEAVEKLAERSGVNLEDKQAQPGKPLPYSNKEELYQANRLTAWHYHQILLNSPQALQAREYLQQRGVDEKQIENFRLGFAADQKEQLLKLLESKNIPIEAALKVGVIKEGHQGSYETFRQRLIFPIFNTEQKVIGLGGRILPGDSSPAKYINSSDSPVYDKSANLFGLHLAKDSIVKTKRVIIVEGYLDVLAMHQFGFSDTVAPLGTALTSRQISLLKRYTSEIILLFDSDLAGWKASERSLGLCLDQGISPKIILLPEGEDPDTFLHKQGKEAFEARLRDPKNLLRVFLDKLLLDANSPEAKSKALKQIAPYLQKLKSSMERNLHIRYLSEKWALPEAWIYEELGLKKTENFSSQNKPLANSNRANLEQSFFEIYLHFPHLRDSLKRLTEVEFFEQETYQNLASFLFNESMTQNLNLQQLTEQCEDEKLKNVLAGFEILQTEQSPETATKMAMDCVSKMKKRMLKDKLSLLSHQIQKAELEQKFEELPELIKNKQQILKVLDE